YTFYPTRRSSDLNPPVAAGAGPTRPPPCHRTGAASSCPASGLLARLAAGPPATALGGARTSCRRPVGCRANPEARHLRSLDVLAAPGAARGIAPAAPGGPGPRHAVLHPASGYGGPAGFACAAAPGPGPRPRRAVGSYPE